MKLRHTVKWALIGVLTMPALTACSSGGGEEGANEVEASEEGNAANNADAGEGNEAAAVEGAETAEGNTANATDGNVAFEDSNGGNAAATAEAPANEIPPELLNSENPAAAGGAEGAVADSALGATGAEGTMPTPAADPATPPPTDAVAAAPAPDAGAPSAPGAAPAAPAPAAPPPGGSRVYYVKADTVALHSEPSATAQSVGNLKKGDPVLVVIEGAWANVVNRGFVEVASLSESPVGRSTGGAKSWQ